MSRKRPGGITPDELEKAIKSGRIDPLYLFLGEELYLKQRALKMLISTVDEASRSFNVDFFSIGQSGINAAISTARQLPMVSPRRIVVIRDFDKLSEYDQETLEEYLKRPVETSCVIFEAESLDQRRRISTALVKSCAVVSFNPLSEKELQQWVENYLREIGCSIETNALGALIGLVGTELINITRELDKLVTYVGRVRRITFPDVEALVVRLRQHSNFELGDAILAGERKRALKLLHRQLEDGSEPVAIVGMLAYSYRRMLIAKQMMARHVLRDEIAREIRMSPYQVSNYLAQVRQIELDRILFGIQRISEVDLAIKTSLATPRLQLEFLICELTSGR